MPWVPKWLTDAWLQRNLAPQLYVAQRTPSGTATLNHHKVAVGPALGLALVPVVQKQAAQRTADCATARLQRCRLRSGAAQRRCLAPAPLCHCRRAACRGHGHCGGRGGQWPRCGTGRCGVGLHAGPPGQARHSRCARPHARPARQQSLRAVARPALRLAGPAAPRPVDGATRQRAQALQPGSGYGCGCDWCGGR